MTDENDTGDSAVDDPIVEMKQSDLGKLMAKVRREGAASASRKEAAAAAAPPQPQAQTIAEIVAATVAALQPPEAQRPTPAAAPSAPSLNGMPTEAGLTNIFAPGVAQQLGPRGLRRELEKLWALGDERSGKPERPTPGKKR